MMQAATMAADLALSMAHPADAVLRNFFAGDRSLGQRDRAFIAETVFAVLRHKRLLEHLVDKPTPRRLVYAALIKIQGYSLGQLETYIKDADREWAIALKAADIESLAPAMRLSLPDWLFDRLVAESSEQEAIAFGRAMLKQAPLDLRVNTMLANREQVIEQLIASGIDAKPTKFSPVGIRVAGKPAINRSDLFTSGAIEVQDEGSQLLAYLVAPKRREMVIDFCAGAGGKTLHMGMMMQSQGRLYAFDVSETRLNNLAPRLKRSGLSNVHPQLISTENDIRVKRLTGKIDRVLIDAPCSGLGTLRRNPDLKWRQSATSIDELAVKQKAIVNAAAMLLRPGGRLVYATCSVLAQENRAVVEEFLATHPDYSKIDCREALDDSHIALDCGEYLELRPQTHDTDAFFAAVLQKNA
jgi:16S rRNA (cytosine967-C5)-methyltransferase